MATPRPKRTSLTRTDLQTSAGLELLEFLQGIAEDGRLTREECDQLRGWLGEKGSPELAATSHLQSVLGEILRDGVITDDELGILHDAILRVLPVDLRSIATLRRREQRNASKVEERQRKEKEREHERAERDRNAPIARADFMIAGASRSAERRDACEACSEGDAVVLEREPDNPYDRNAILIRDLSGEEMGYVPRDAAASYASLLDLGSKQTFSVKKCLETAAGRVIPVIRGELYGADADLPETKQPKRHPSTAPRSVTSTYRIPEPPLQTSATLKTSPRMLVIVGLSLLVVWLLLSF